MDFIHHVERRGSKEAGNTTYAEKGGESTNWAPFIVSPIPCGIGPLCGCQTASHTTTRARLAAFPHRRPSCRHIRKDPLDLG